MPTLPPYIYGSEAGALEKLWTEREITKYGDAMAQHARRVALEEAAKLCESMHDEDRPGDYAYAIRAAAQTQGGT
jgi:hypothetical protein